MNGRDYSIKLNSFELGVLSGVIMQLDDKDQRALRGVWEQLVEFKRQFEKEAGGKEGSAPWGYAENY